MDFVLAGIPKLGLEESLGRKAYLICSYVMITKTAIPPALSEVEGTLRLRSCAA